MWSSRREYFQRTFIWDLLREHITFWGYLFFFCKAAKIILLFLAPDEQCMWHERMKHQRGKKNSWYMEVREWLDFVLSLLNVSHESCQLCHAVDILSNLSSNGWFDQVIHSFTSWIRNRSLCVTSFIVSYLRRRTELVWTRSFFIANYVPV